MNMIEWLYKGDVVIQRLTAKYLLNQPIPYDEGGFIQRYLALFDQEQRMWGGGIYSPKFISTFYTMMELMYMEIDPQHPYFVSALMNILNHMWYRKGHVAKTRYQDMCIVGMMVHMAAYAHLKDEKINEMIDYILLHQFSDGGWNCQWQSATKPTKSSLHTTLSVLEGLRVYQNHQYTYRLKEIGEAIPLAQDFILRKRLFRSERTGEIIHPDMQDIHYPPRWKYDAYRALEYFQSVNYPYDSRMQEAIDRLLQRLKNGYLGSGKQIAGKNHFRLDSTKEGRFNTLRALKIIKYYCKDSYEDIIKQQVGN